MSLKKYAKSVFFTFFFAIAFFNGFFYRSGKEQIGAKLSSGATCKIMFTYIGLYRDVGFLEYKMAAKSEKS